MDGWSWQGRQGLQGRTPPPPPPPRPHHECALAVAGKARPHSSIPCRPALTANHHVKCEVLLGSDFESFGFRISLPFSLQKVIREGVRWR